MVTSSRACVVGLMLLTGVLGYFAVVSSYPGTHVAGMWPIGLATGVLVLATRPMLPWVAGGVLVLTFVTIDLGGYPAGVAAGYAVGIVVEGFVTQHVLGIRWGERRNLSDDLDMGRYTLAAVLGWTALRAPMGEALVQLLFVGVVSNTLVTFGRGPFLALEVVRGRPSELSVIPHRHFCWAAPWCASPSPWRSAASGAAPGRPRTNANDCGGSSRVPAGWRSSRPTGRAGSRCSTPAPRPSSGTPRRRCSGDRMVSNLTTNAVKFSPEGGTIVLRVRSYGGRCAIDVQDTGVGIPQEEQPQLFNRFFRSTYAQSEAIKGSGLGLSIARSIAHRHGARISATSTPRRGSVFTVTFEDPQRGAVPVPRSPL